MAVNGETSFGPVVQLEFDMRRDPDDSAWMIVVKVLQASGLSGRPDAYARLCVTHNGKVVKGTKQKGESAGRSNTPIFFGSQFAVCVTDAIPQQEWRMCVSLHDRSSLLSSYLGGMSLSGHELLADKCKGGWFALLPEQMARTSGIRIDSSTGNTNGPIITAPASVALSAATSSSSLAGIATVAVSAAGLPLAAMTSGATTPTYAAGGVFEFDNTLYGARAGGPSPPRTLLRSQSDSAQMKVLPALSSSSSAAAAASSSSSVAAMSSLNEGETLLIASHSGRAQSAMGSSSNSSVNVSRRQQHQHQQQQQTRVRDYCSFAIA